MKKGDGFLIIEIAISLGLISIFFAILAGYLAKIAEWQSEATLQINAVNCASSCLEKQVYNSSSCYEVTLKNEAVNVGGRWSPSLQADELQELQKNFMLNKLSLTWQSPFGKKRSYSLISGQCEKRG